MARPMAVRKVRRFRVRHARRILELLQQGESPVTIGAMPDMPSEKWIWEWAKGPVDQHSRYAPMHTAFQQRFEELWTIYKESTVDRCIRESLPIGDVLHVSGWRDPKNAMAEVQLAKLRVDTRLKLPALIQPEKFGPKVEPRKIDASVVFQTINYFQAAPSVPMAPPPREPLTIEAQPA